ncbi:hypothetical protein SKAU_G00089550 [Synaphobranchus kaupii]|uniref:Uncharacterized protein n=1 Tax=Synaphobranchus kaupii TaxID=118154 RepID=A0A9Q1J598_SYNKA|nr:hypothetical protein SKAU_G00089550 [Synaphobranchus kaupii]
MTTEPQQHSSTIIPLPEHSIVTAILHFSTLHITLDESICRVTLFRVFFHLPRTRHRVPTRSRGTAAWKSASSQQRDADGGGDRDALCRYTMVFSDKRRRQREPPCSQAGGQLTVASFRLAVAVTNAHPPPVPRHYGALTVSSAV